MEGRGLGLWWGSNVLDLPSNEKKTCPEPLERTKEDHMRRVELRQRHLHLHQHMERPILTNQLEH